MLSVPFQKRERIADGVTLYLGDCREILPMIGNIDTVLTDPPYGVNLGSNKSHRIGNRPYESSFLDTQKNVSQTVIPVIDMLRRSAKRVVVTPGTRCVWAYPSPDELGAIYFPAGHGFSKWGFTCSQPILFYGKDPFPMCKKPNSVECTETTEKNGHPCPKPINLMRWLVDRTSKPGEIILDPFMGSGTTGVAAVQLGRRFIGMEIEQKYFDIACRRISNALDQQDMFIEKPKPVQECLALQGGQ